MVGDIAPLAFGGAEGGLAGSLGNGDEAKGEGGVEGFAELDDVRFAGVGFRICALPFGGVDGGSIFGEDGEGLAKFGGEGEALLVGPRGVGD